MQVIDIVASGGEVAHLLLTHGIVQEVALRVFGGAAWSTQFRSPETKMDTKINSEGRIEL